MPHQHKAPGQDLVASSFNFPGNSNTEVPEAFERPQKQAKARCSSLDIRRQPQDAGTLLGALPKAGTILAVHERDESAVGK